MTLKEARFMLVLMAIFLGGLLGSSGIKYIEEGRYIMAIIVDIGCVCWLFNAWKFYKSPWVITYTFNNGGR